jgi:hypothetical protein
MGNLDDALGRVEKIRNLLYDKNGMEDPLAEELNQAHYSLQLLQEELESAWNEIYEIFSDFEDLGDGDIVNLKETIHGRVEKAMELIGEEIPDQGEQMEGLQESKIGSPCEHERCACLKMNGKNKMAVSMDMYINWKKKKESQGMENTSVEDFTTWMEEQIDNIW